MLKSKKLLLLIITFTLTYSSLLGNEDSTEEDTIELKFNKNLTEETMVNGKKYKVFRAIPDTQEQLNFLLKLYQDHSRGIEMDFWKKPTAIFAAVDVMIKEDDIKVFCDSLNNESISSYVIVDDVQKLIEEREATSRRNQKIYETMHQYDDSTNSTTDERYNFHSYSSYPKMQKWMKALSIKYSHFVKYITIGKTHEGRNIDGLEIGGNDRRKKIFWIDGGIHAREWAAPHTALYFIHQLTSRYGNDKNITNYVDKLAWIIIPSLNPDGYEFSRSIFSPTIRLWRKNRSPPKCYIDDWGRKRCCRGVDLNRNFDFHFKEAGSSDDPCSEIYQGETPFSEPESAAVRNTIFSPTYKGRFDGFVTLHTYSQIWIHPYGHKKDSYPGDINDLYAVGKKAAKALKQLYGTEYVVGSGADTLYPASGGSEDWAKSKANIKFVYLLELRPDEHNWDGFILKERELIPTATETWIGIKVVADAIIDRLKTQQPSRESSSRYHFGNGGEGSCYDLRYACKRWVQENESLCKEIPEFMRTQCSYSCGYC
uniref:ShKT domain-containing protein n=1 Tax=Parastrongyloides trichosuri TaxID=131310 RepID=A0A0N4Z0C3_PARTI